MKTFYSVDSASAEMQLFTIHYSYVGQQRACEVKEQNDKEAQMYIYTCRLLPSTLEITIRQISAGNDSKWIHNKGIVDDLAAVIGGAIESYKRRNNL